MTKQSRGARKQYQRGGNIVADTPEQFAAFIRKEIPKWTAVVKTAGVKVDRAHRHGAPGTAAVRQYDPNVCLSLNESRISKVGLGWHNSC